MYKLLIIRKYLFRKIAPLFASLSVMLCTAMVIIVMSVMGGFLEMMRESVKSQTGEIVVTGDWTGFAHYDELIAGFKELEAVEHATPVIRSAGMARLQIGQSNYVQVVPEIYGVRPADLDRVTPFKSTLYWNRQHLIDETGVKNPSFDPTAMAMQFAPSDDMKKIDPNVEAMIPGIELFRTHSRDEKGQYDISRSLMGGTATLTIVPVTQQGGFLDPAVKEFQIVNEFKTGLYEYDSGRIYIAFDILQRMMRMDSYEEYDPETGKATGRTIPGRTSFILVKLKEETDLALARDQVTAVIAKAKETHPDLVFVYAQTWEERHRTLLNAVGNERALVTILFAIISFVAVVMIATVFYMIVLEKTRDIGILRALGASRMGIGIVFIQYGVVIGIVGAVLGVIVGVTFVYNLNELQAVLKEWFGWQMWNPETYYFDQIPERINATEVTSVALASVVSSIIGALIPATIAAFLKPVEALRYE